jgi:hypothetical protein
MALQNLPVYKDLGKTAIVNLFCGTSQNPSRLNPN